MIDISKMNKAEVLAALYNRARPLGMGMLHFTPQDMTESEAEELLKQQQSFDYLKGRVMKVNLSKDMLKTGLYNRDNGFESAENTLSKLDGFCVVAE